MKTEVIIDKVKKYILMASVRLLSIVSTSLENRFLITGLVLSMVTENRTWVLRDSTKGSRVEK
jgi:hypothetical protein